MILTSTPCPLVSVNRSTRPPSGNVPNVDWVTAIAAARRRAPPMSQRHEIGDPDRLLLIDAVADRDAGQARHRAGARVGEPHVFGQVSLAEDEVAHAIVAAAVAGKQLR